jgi:CelD/BcsL family acetyltransferase involved in cellulose biosynthesis
VQRHLGLGIATYLGGSHFNLNLPLADPHLRLGAHAATALLDAYAKAAGADLVLLRNQPERWKGIQHPFLCLPHYGAPDDVRLVVIDGDFDSYLLRQLSRKMRSELRRKTMKFKDAGIDGATRAGSAEVVERYLTTFIEQKSKRLAAQGLDDPFILPGVKAFLREAALSGTAGEGGLEIHAIVRDGHILSVRAGVRHRDHLSFMVQSFDTDEALAKYTPSEFLLTEVLLAGRTQGVANFDFGVGDGRFKQVWSNDVVPMFNIAQGVTRTGQVMASLMQSKDAAKRYIKRHKRLFSAVQDARALGAKLRSLPGLIVT